MKRTLKNPRDPPTEDEEEDQPKIIELEGIIKWSFSYSARYIIQVPEN
jgi:hypothetical protein